MIAILDYGVGNLTSVQKAFDLLSSKVRVVRQAQDLLEAEKIVIPGVGAFGAAMENLKQMGALPILQSEVIEKKKPFLGICVGMQILAERGFEFGTHQGLGWIKGDVKPLTEIAGTLPVPNMGWNEVASSEDPQFQNIRQGSSFYFANSFFFDCQEADRISAKIHYGQNFPCALRKDNIWAAQFHPEKSQKVGIQFLKNFIENA